METRHEAKISKQIANLLFVLSLGVFFAGSFAALLLYYYSPSGTYTLSNVLLSPEMMGNLSYVDKNPATGKMIPYVFEESLYVFWDPERNQWKKHTVAAKKYAQFYKKLEGEKSVLVTPEISSHFFRDHPSRLVLYTKPADANPQLSPLQFQEVQFSANTPYYRVEIHEQNSETKWTYFYHPGIYEEAHDLLTKGL